MKTIIRMLHEAATRFPSRAYTTKKTDDGWKAYTYPDVDAQSDQIAAYLIGHGCVKTCTFGILAEGRPEWIIGELGVIKAQGISVPLSIKLTPKRLLSD
jgi:long-chain acyl-CoA synthetase